MPGFGDPLPTGHQRGHPSESPSASMSSLLLKPAGILFPVPQGNHTPQAKPDFVKKLFLYYPFHRYIGVLPAPVELWKVLFEVINVSFFSSSVGNEAGEGWCLARTEEKSSAEGLWSPS